MADKSAKLVIVYNADSGAINAVLHALHKALRPETYPCSLCALTYGAVSMHREWKRFLETLPLDVIFHHKDDYAAAYHGAQPDLPAILSAEAGEVPVVLIGADELDALESVAGLIALTKDRLAERYGASDLAA